MIRFVNAAGKLRFSLHALEMRLFRSGQTEVLVPHLYGVPEAPSAGRHRWTKEEFFQVATERLTQEELGVVEDLFTWAKQHAGYISWGSGAQNGSFTFWFRKNDARSSVFSVFTDGKVWLNFGSLGDVDESKLEAFYDEITATEGLQDIGEFRGKWPQFRVGDVFVASAAAVEAFKQAVADFGEAIKKSDT